ncbi:hypothetical protein [Nocardia sp. NPDC058666]
MNPDWEEPAAQLLLAASIQRWKEVHHELGQADYDVIAAVDVLHKQGADDEVIRAEFAETALADDLDLILGLVRMRDEVATILSEAGLTVTTPDDTEELWVDIVGLPHRMVGLRHGPGSTEAEVADLHELTRQVANRAVPVLYSSGFVLASTVGHATVPLTESAAIDAFSTSTAEFGVVRQHSV